MVGGEAVDGRDHMPENHRQPVEPALRELTISKELGVRRSRPTYEFLYDFTPDRGVVNHLLGRGVDLLSFTSRDFIKVEGGLLHTKVVDNIALLKVGTYEGWWNDQINKKARNSIRKAEKSGIHISIFEDVGSVPDEMFIGIWKIYNETPIRQERAFPHYGISLESVKSMARNVTEKMEFHFAHLDGEVIGFSEVIYGDRVAQISQILSMMRHFEKAPNNALLSSVVRRCSELGYPFILYGRMGLGHPTLTKFKESNGFRQFDVSRYFIPLTHRGAVAIKLGLHRQLKDAIPETIKYSLLPLFSFISRNFKVEL
jgi:hypothetical protein